jgi:hypothetical protein
VTRRVYAPLVMSDLEHRAYVRLIAGQHGVEVPWMRPLADDVRRFTRALRWWVDSLPHGTATDGRSLAYATDGVSPGHNGGGAAPRTAHSGNEGGR